MTDNRGVMVQTPETLAAIRAANPAIGHTYSDTLLTRDPDMAAMVEYWDLTDTIIDGVNAMKLAAETYMPRFTDEDDDEYKDRQKVVKMTNVYRDGVEGLASKPFEKEVSLVEDDEKKAPQDIIDFTEDVDGAGNNLTAFASLTFFNGINSAIDWIFVDHPPLDPTIRNEAERKAKGAKPYWSHVLGRNVYAARATVIAGRERLTFVRIFEPGKPDHVREFTRSDTGVVTFKLWERTDQWHDHPDGGRTQFVVIQQGIITIDDIPLVPFITGRRNGRTFKLLPALRDAADLQKNLFQNESALEWNKRMGAYSMLAGNGVKPERDEANGIKKIRVGPARVLYAPPSGDGSHGSWSFVQPSAEIMKYLHEDNVATIGQIRELARQPLVATMGITVVQAGMAAGKAKSAVQAWALALKNALENAMVLTCKFRGIKPEVYDPVIFVYTDFDEFMEGKDLDALNSAVEKGKISDQTYREELHRRRVLSDEYDEEREIQRLLEQTPGDGEDTDIDEINTPPQGE